MQREFMALAPSKHHRYVMGRRVSSNSREPLVYLSTSIAYFTHTKIAQDGTNNSQQGNCI